MTEPVQESNPRGYENEWLHELAPVVNRLNDGDLDTKGAVTLTPSAGTTEIKDPRIHKNTHLFLSPQTANAAAALATTYWTAADGVLTITHTNDALTDKTFSYLFLG